MLSKCCLCDKTDNLTVIGFLKGESDYTLMLDAHIDQIAMIVTNVDDDGFLTVKNSGGIDIRALPSRRVTVHGKEKITGRRFMKILFSPVSLFTKYTAAINRASGTAKSRFAVKSLAKMFKPESLAQI